LTISDLSLSRRHCVLTRDDDGYQLRDLEIWLGRDRTEDRFEDWRPDRLLTGLLETDGGYLEPALT
jgi:pSer/pThr/pTyr-binding forkhead associated (FHA) protein